MIYTLSYLRITIYQKSFLCYNQVVVNLKIPTALTAFGIF
ncbi:hypothetical protein ELI_2649 [Eubacterium callanderi]|uniref:Uncharacterized protein n=1 Tax=Eubacterium callanderi TaxID=53442 RepID=E3GP26_9FIRM|nr:hypothetical protein ELI_2649 [Eubacterium callanderi]